MRWRLLLITLVVVLPFITKAQDKGNIPDTTFEGIFIDPENVDNLEEVYQDLYHLYNHPLNLNNADHDAFKPLIFLSIQQIEAILNYRAKAGGFTSVYELQAIREFTMEELKVLALFVTVNPYMVAGESNNYVLIRHERDLQQRKGYKPIQEERGESPYKGTPDKILIRARGTVSKNINYGLTADKDPGENIILDKGTRRYGMDHYSLYVQYKGTGKLKTMIIGDYQLQFGQGLVYSSGFSLGKSGGDIARFRRVTTGIRPHSSTLESGFMRGTALTFGSNELQFTAFASSNKNDASIDMEDHSFSNINPAGFHRTVNELASKNNLSQKDYGLVLNYIGKYLNAGIGYTYNFFDYSWTPADRLYNINAFRGHQLNTIFNFLSYRWRNTNVFVEQAYLFNGGYAVVSGLLVNLTSSLQTGFIYRNYAPGFASIYGSAIGEKSKNSNEKGGLWLLNWKFKKKAQVSFYFDTFSFPWLSFRISQPSDGYEYLARVQYNFSKKKSILLQYKQQEKGQDILIDKINIVHKNVKKQYQLVLNSEITGALSFKTRLQGSSSSLMKSHGFAIMQDVKYRHLKYAISFRYALFDVEDFDNRQYVYENDLLYSFSFPALYGKGSRYYLMVKYNLSKRLKLWARYSSTIYSDRNIISSGSEEIVGNKLSDVKLQLMYKF